MYLEITINQPVSFKVVIVFAKRIYQTFGHFQPPHVEEKLDTRHTQKETRFSLRPLQLDIVVKRGKRQPLLGEMQILGRTGLSDRQLVDDPLAWP